MTAWDVVRGSSITKNTDSGHVAAAPGPELVTSSWPRSRTRSKTPSDNWMGYTAIAWSYSIVATKYPATMSAEPATGIHMRSRPVR